MAKHWVMLEYQMIAFVPIGAAYRVDILLLSIFFRFREKCLIHAQDVKANSFKKLVGEFLDDPAFENQDKGKVIATLAKRSPKALVIVMP